MCRITSQVVPGTMLLFFACFASTSGAEREVIQDPHFRRGLILWEAAPGQHVKYGQVSGFEPGSKPIWGLAQWSSRLPLESPLSNSYLHTGVVLSNAAKVVKLGCEGTDLGLAVNSGVEYSNRSRKADQPWVHLLVEQEFEKPVFLSKLSAASFHLEARLLHSTNLHRGDYDPGLHAAQLQVFFTLQNRNRQSPGHGDFLWFGIPVYDNRHPQPPEYKSRDFGGTGKFIFTPAATAFTSATAHDGNWIVCACDLLPLFREALTMAWAKGFLSGSKDIADYAVGGMNMGWEVPGSFDVELQIRNLSLLANDNAPRPLKELPVPGASR